MRSAFFLVYFVSITFFANAKFGQDIIESFSSKPRFFLDVTGYTSFMKGDQATFSGIRTGLNYNNTVKVGLGISRLNSSVVTPIQVFENNSDYTTNGALRLLYGEVIFEYVFYKEKSWQLSVPIGLGLGKMHYKYISRSDDALTRSPSYPVWLFHPELAAEYKVLKWVGATASFGCLTSLGSTKKFYGNLSTPTFSVGVKLYFDAIWDEVFNK
jgi:hypothetical protein